MMEKTVRLLFSLSGQCWHKLPYSYGYRAETVSGSQSSFRLLVFNSIYFSRRFISRIDWTIGSYLSTVSFVYINRIINSPNLESGRNFVHKHNVSNIIGAREQCASAQRRNYVKTRWVYTTQSISFSSNGHIFGDYILLDFCCFIPCPAMPLRATQRVLMQNCKKITEPLYVCIED